jgi:hypothetical protein
LLLAFGYTEIRAARLTQGFRSRPPGGSSLPCVLRCPLYRAGQLWLVAARGKNKVGQATELPLPPAGGRQNVTDWTGGQQPGFSSLNYVLKQFYRKKSGPRTPRPPGGPPPPGQVGGGGGGGAGATGRPHFAGSAATPRPPPPAPGRGGPRGGGESADPICFDTIVLIHS